MSLTATDRAILLRLEALLERIATAVEDPGPTAPERTTLRPDGTWEPQVYRRGRGWVPDA